MADSTLQTEEQTRPALATRGRHGGAAPTPPVQPANVANQLAEEIAQRVWDRLPIATLQETGVRSMEQVIRAASGSHRQLVAYREDLARLPGLLSTITLRFSGDPPSPSLRERLEKPYLDELKLDAHPDLPTLSFVDAAFADMLPEIAAQHAVSMLKKHCLALVNTLVGWLDRLQQQHLIGSVTYYDSSCRFTHVERHLEIDAEGGRTIERRRAGSEKETAFHRTYSVDHYQEFDYTVRSSRVTLVHEVYQHELRRFENCQSAVPREYQQFIEVLPEWLQPSVRLLEGQLINHRRVARDLSSEKHALTELVRTEERSVWQFDPGILLGNYVIAGWARAEIAAEEEARSQERLTAQHGASLRQASRFFVAAGLTAAASLAMLWVSQSWAVLAGFAALFLVNRAFDVQHTASGHPHRALRDTCVTGAAGFALLALLDALLYASPSALSAALALAVFSWLVRRFSADETS